MYVHVYREQVSILLPLINRTLRVCIGNGLVEKWIISNDLHYLLWQTIDDGDGYVRAAVVNALASLHSSDTLWQDFTLQHVSQACRTVVLTFLLHDAL